MTMEDVGKFITLVGIAPSGLAYLLHYITKRLNGRLDRVSESNIANTEAVQGLATEIRQLVAEIRSSKETR